MAAADAPKCRHVTCRAAVLTNARSHICPVAAPISVQSASVSPAVVRKVKTPVSHPPMRRSVTAAPVVGRGAASIWTASTGYGRLAVNARVRLVATVPGAVLLQTLHSNAPSALDSKLSAVQPDQHMRPRRPASVVLRRLAKQRDARQSRPSDTAGTTKQTAVGQACGATSMRMDWRTGGRPMDLVLSCSAGRCSVVTAGPTSYL